MGKSQGSPPSSSGVPAPDGVVARNSYYTTPAHSPVVIPPSFGSGSPERLEGIIFF